jgi:hypothetical protein
MEKEEELEILGDQYLASLTINDLKVPNKNIQSIAIREWIFDHVFTLELTIMDVGTFMEYSPLFDESPIKLTISKNDKTSSYTMSFVLNCWESQKLNVDGGNAFIIRMSATPEINNYFYPQYSRCFVGKTTVEIIKQIDRETPETKSKIHIDDSNDAQNWYQIALTNFDMIKHIMKRAYYNIEDLPMVYMDRYKTLHYNSLKTMCKQTPKFNAYCDDSLVLDNGNDPIMKKRLESYLVEPGKENIFFSTNSSTRNIASVNNKIMGYGFDLTYFDHSNFYRQVINFKFSPLSKYADVNKGNYNKLTQSFTYNTKHSNTHNNYMVAQGQNEYIKNVFFSKHFQIVINPNSNIQLGDIINVNIPDKLSSFSSNTQSIDKVNSGSYLVGGIMQDIKKDGQYAMVLTLFRNGVNSPDNKDITFDMLEVK